MPEKVSFHYFQGEESEQYTFYRIPKQLFTLDYFKGLSSDAKILYGLMLDRMSLSIKNNWFDDQNRAYIYFSIEDIVEYLGCGKNKAVKLMKELDVGTGIGLIEKRRQGFGKSNIIYVKKFMVEIPVEISRNKDSVEESPFTEPCKNQTSVRSSKSIESKDSTDKPELDTIDSSEKTDNTCYKDLVSIKNKAVKGRNDEETLGDPYLQKFDNQTTCDKLVATESLKANFMNPQNQHSRIPKNNIHEVCFREPNNTYRSNNKYNYNKSNLISSDDPYDKTPDDQIDEIRFDNETSNSPQQTRGVNTTSMDQAAMIREYGELIRRNIDYDTLITAPETEHGLVQEIYELILETVTCLGDEIVISSNRYPAEIVRSRFMKLNYMHIRYVMDCLEKNTTKVNNIRKYLLATLFNAPATMEGYYRAEVKHDFYNCV